ncbi:MAG TPA: antibiotic biosynthesis monooxygenase [Candidatus Acidoferrales bacterium]|nr:antibiotic biosynthesis monooxygenase [Candidatus Acidoferrales bacterium]
MVRFVWAFVARAERIQEFERYYSGSGPWAALFRKNAGYHGTLLLRDTETPRRYLTIDRWDSVASHRAMRERFAKEWQELDKAGEAFAESERREGVFEES